MLRMMCVLRMLCAFTVYEQHSQPAFTISQLINSAASSMTHRR